MSELLSTATKSPDVLPPILGQDVFSSYRSISSLLKKPVIFRTADQIKKQFPDQDGWKYYKTEGNYLVFIRQDVETSYTFDPEGRMITSIQVQDKISRKETYKYNLDGFVTEKKVEKQGKPKVVDHFVYAFSKKGIQRPVLITHIDLENVHEGPTFISLVKKPFKLKKDEKERFIPCSQISLKAFIEFLSRYRYVLDNAWKKMDQRLISAREQLSDQIPFVRISLPFEDDANNFATFFSFIVQVSKAGTSIVL